MSHPIEDLRRLLADEAIPEVDVTDKVMSRIYELEVKKRPVFVNRKVAIVLLALLICATGFASYNMFQLFDKRGDVSLKYGKLIAPTTLDDILQQTIKIRDQMLAEGEARAFFWILHGVDGVEDGSLKIIYMQKPYLYQTPEETGKHAGLYLKTVPPMLKGYRFTQSIIQHRMGRMWNHMTEEIAQYPKTTLFKTEPVELLPEVQSCTLEYVKDDQKILVDIDPWVSNTRFSNRLQELGMAKIRLSNSEALLVVENNEKMVIWVREGADYGFVCSVVTQANIPEEELIKIAEEVDCWELPSAVDFSTRPRNLP